MLIGEGPMADGGTALASPTPMEWTVYLPGTHGARDGGGQQMKLKLF